MVWLLAPYSSVHGSGNPGYCRDPMGPTVLDRLRTSLHADYRRGACCGGADHPSSLIRRGCWLPPVVSLTSPTASWIRRRTMSADRRVAAAGAPVACLEAVRQRARV